MRGYRLNILLPRWSRVLIWCGTKMELDQNRIEQRGHAIEARIYAEDPENNFLPSPGAILFLDEPSGPGIRVDSGIYQGWNVPPHYDPILGKLIVWSEDRATAIRRMSCALEQYTILGIKTNLGYLKRIMDNQGFRDGNYHTHFIEENAGKLVMSDEHLPAALIGAALVMTLKERAGKDAAVGAGVRYSTTPWQELGSWEICAR